MKLISKYINKIKQRLQIKELLKAFEWCLTDRQYLKFVYRIKMGKPLHLNPPITFNEKLQWLKLYNRRDEYTAMVDKVEAKKVAASRIGEEYIIPTLGIWDSVDDIDFDALPDKFVLKTTHGGGGNAIVLCRDKSLLNRSAVKNVLHRSLRKGDSYRWLKEWPYKNVRRRIIAEEMLEDEANEQIVDYKFYCFHGKPYLVLVCFDRGHGKTKYYYFDRNWTFQRINTMGQQAPMDFTLSKPKNIDEMFFLAEKLSAGEPFIRIDLYNVNGRIYFGEYTFYPASGFKSDLSPDADLDLGRRIVLPAKYY